VRTRRDHHLSLVKVPRSQNVASDTLADFVDWFSKYIYLVTRELQIEVGALKSPDAAELNKPARTRLKCFRSDREMKIYLDGS
jgi:hypothetical protein